MKNSAPVRRTAEIEEITNIYFIHPIAARLVPLFAKTRLTPNAVSLGGLLFGILAGLAYYRYQDPLWTITGFLLMIAWHVMDGADGQLARLTHSQSHLGQVLDGIADHVTFLAVYTALAIGLGRRYGDWMYALVIAAAACHAVQSATYEAQRQEYEAWASERSSPESARPHSAGEPAGHRLFAFYYLRFGFPAAGVTRKFRAAMTGALQRQPGRAALVRQRYRKAFAPLLRQWSVLSANYRTLGIFVAALLKAPQYYFGFEIVGFSAIMVLLIHRQDARGKMFIDSLGSTTAVSSP